MRADILIVMAAALGAALATRVQSADVEKSGSSSSPFVVKLDLMRRDEQVSPRVHVKLDLPDWTSEEHEFESGCGSFHLYAKAEGEAYHVWSQHLNPEPSFIRASGGGFLNLSSMTMDENDVLQYSSCGGIKLAAHVQAEADDDASNVNLAGGGELAYSGSGVLKDWFVGPPSMGIAFEAVKPERADARDEMGVSDATFSRMRVFALWTWRLGDKCARGVPILGRIALRAHYSLVREFSQPSKWEAARYDEYDQFDGTLCYEFDPARNNAFGFREIYAGYSTGRQIAHAEDDDRILIGVVLQ